LEVRLRVFVALDAMPSLCVSRHCFSSAHSSAGAHNVPSQLFHNLVTYSVWLKRAVSAEHCCVLLLLLLLLPLCCQVLPAREARLIGALPLRMQQGAFQAII
jgi:hypothetical protein